MCWQASRCGRICPNLVKQHGLAGVWCIDLATDKKVSLYPALKDPEFKCPKGLFGPTDKEIEP